MVSTDGLVGGLAVGLAVTIGGALLLSGNRLRRVSNTIGEATPEMPMGPMPAPADVSGGESFNRATDALQGALEDAGVNPGAVARNVVIGGGENRVSETGPVDVYPTGTVDVSPSSVINPTPPRRDSDGGVDVRGFDSPSYGGAPTQNIGQGSGVSLDQLSDDANLGTAWD